MQIKKQDVMTWFGYILSAGVSPVGHYALTNSVPKLSLLFCDSVPPRYLPTLPGNAYDIPVKCLRKYFHFKNHMFSYELYVVMLSFGKCNM